MTLTRYAALAAGLTCALSAGPADSWWKHVLYLADDRLEGRNTGSRGHRLAAEYVAAEFERAGLKPGGDRAYMQPVKFGSRRILEPECSLELVRGGKATPLKLGDDAVLSLRGSKADPKVDAELVFAGYGLRIPEAGHDDFAGLDVRGKVVVYLSGAPKPIAGPLRAHYQAGEQRNRVWAETGAAGAIAVYNPRNEDVPWSRSRLARTQPSMSLSEAGVAVPQVLGMAATMNPAKAEILFAGSGHTYAEILAADDAGKPLPRFALNARVRATQKIETAELESDNIIGVLPGSDSKLKDEYVVLSAHVDHVGVGAPINGDSIYNGAMDNASGTATLIEVARMLRDGGVRPKRSIAFVAVTGEEKGLQGSRYFALRPTLGGRMVANVNVDMFLPIVPMKLLTVYGLNESDLGEAARRAAAEAGVTIQDDPEPERNIFIRSDQYSFIRQGVPALSFKVGYEKGSPEAVVAKKWLTERYHAPSDDVKQPVNFEAAAKFNQVMFTLVREIAAAPSAPKWKDSSFFKRFEK